MTTRTNNIRKLIAEPLLAKLYMLYKTGVPLAKLIATNQLDVSAPHLKKLFLIYIEILDEAINTNTLHYAMFPIWLTEGVQIQPENWVFKGTFPNGTWVIREATQPGSEVES